METLYVGVFFNGLIFLMECAVVPMSFFLSNVLHRFFIDPLFITYLFYFMTENKNETLFKSRLSVVEFFRSGNTVHSHIFGLFFKKIQIIQ